MMIIVMTMSILIINVVVIAAKHQASYSLRTRHSTPSIKLAKSCDLVYDSLTSVDESADSDNDPGL